MGRLVRALVLSDDTQAEQTLLGTLLQFPATVDDMARRIKPKDFFHPRNQFVYEAVLGLRSEGNPVSPESVCSALGRKGILNKVGGAPYLTELVQANTTAEAASYYAGIVLEKSRLRRIKDLGNRLIQATELDADIAVECVHKFMEEAEVDRESDGDGFDEAYESWVEWYENDSAAIPTPWPGVNSLLLGGLHRGRVYMIAGRPGAGKSAFCLNAVLQAARAGYRSVIYSLEMGREECMARILSSATGVPLKHLFTHRLSEQDRIRIDHFATSATRPFMTINDRSSQTIESIMADCRGRKKKGLDLVVIDHSLLLDPSDKRWTNHQQVTHVFAQCKRLSRRLGCAVVLAHQMNRAKDGQNRKPIYSDLREGGEADSDVVIVLDRDDANNQIAAHLLKNRFGPADRVASLVDELAYGRLG